MTFTKRMRTLLRLILIILLVAVTGGVLIFASMEKYIVYSPSGARLELPKTDGEDGVATDPAPVTADVVIQAAAASILDPAAEPFSVMYIPADVLSEISSISELSELGDNSMIVLDVFGSDGTLTQISPRLLYQLRQLDCRVLAQVSVLCDDSYALSAPTCALAASDGALLRDENGDRWLDPASEAVTERVLEKLDAVTSLGLTDVLLTSFRFPDGDAAYSYPEDADHSAILTALADRVLSVDGLTVSLRATGEELGSSDGIDGWSEKFDLVFAETARSADASALIDTLSREHPQRPASEYLVLVTDDEPEGAGALGVMRLAAEDGQAEDETEEQDG